MTADSNVLLDLHTGFCRVLEMWFALTRVSCWVARDDTVLSDIFSYTEYYD